MEETKKTRGRPKGAKDKQPRKPRDPELSRAVLEKARKKSPITQLNHVKLPEGYNTKRVRFMQEILPTEPLDYNDVQEMERRFNRYLNLCAEWDMKVGNMAAYAAIGIDKDIVSDWVTIRRGNPERTAFLKKVKRICAMYREGLMEDNKVYPATGIFWQKNYDGLKDEQEIVLKPNADPLGEQRDAETLKQKYLESTYGVVELPEKAGNKPLELPLPTKEPLKVE